MLFRSLILTPSEHTQHDDFINLARFWEELGMNVFSLPGETHDRILARTSHLPHFLSVMLANTLSPENVDFCGSGFHSMIRLANGETTVWLDIAETNRENILDAMDEFQIQFEQVRNAIEKGDRVSLSTLLQSIAKGGFHSSEKTDIIEKILFRSPLQEKPS